MTSPAPLALGPQTFIEKDRILAQLPEVLANAKASAAGSARWASAVEKAGEALEHGHWAFTVDGVLFIRSRTLGSLMYQVTHGACPCEAARHGKPCAHRAARQLCIRALGIELEQEERAKRRNARSGKTQAELEAEVADLY